MKAWFGLNASLRALIKDWEVLTVAATAVMEMTGDTVPHWEHHNYKLLSMICGQQFVSLVFSANLYIILIKALLRHCSDHDGTPASGMFELRLMMKPPRTTRRTRRRPLERGEKCPRVSCTKCTPESLPQRCSWSSWWTWNCELTRS